MPRAAPHAVSIAEIRANPGLYQYRHLIRVILKAKRASLGSHLSDDDDQPAVRGRLRIEPDRFVVGERHVCDEEIAGIEVLD
jgi:hypothetical protein